MSSIAFPGLKGETGGTQHLWRAQSGFRDKDFNGAPLKGSYPRAAFFLLLERILGEVQSFAPFFGQELGFGAGGVVKFCWIGVRDLFDLSG